MRCTLRLPVHSILDTWAVTARISLIPGNARGHRPLLQGLLTSRRKEEHGPHQHGGSIATAGGVVFIGATNDKRFRAFDARTGKELWVTKLDNSAIAVPMTYQAKGKHPRWRGEELCCCLGVSHFAGKSTYSDDPVISNPRGVFSTPQFVHVAAMSKHYCKQGFMDF